MIEFAGRIQMKFCFMTILKAKNILRTFDKYAREKSRYVEVEGLYLEIKPRNENRIKCYSLNNIL